MTIIYRVQTRPVTDEDAPGWLVEWLPTATEALEKHDECVALSWPTRTTKHDIPSGRETLCQALNLNDVNFTVWPGEEVRRDDPELIAP